jgi:tubulin-specific chaperone E
MPDTVTFSKQSNSGLDVRCLKSLPSERGDFTAVRDSPLTTLKVLRTMSLRTFRLKALKTFKAPREARARLWLRMADDTFSEIGTDGRDDSGDLSWWGLEDGSEVLLFVEK